METIRYFIYINGKEYEVGMREYYMFTGAKARTIKREKPNEKNT